MKKYLKLIVTFIFISYLPDATAQLIVEVVPLQNRTVEQIVPVIRPLVSEGGTVTGMNNQLVIKTTPANLAEIKKLLLKLDTAPRRLLITVRQDVDSDIYRRGDSVDGRYSGGNVTISGSGNTPGRPGTEVTARDNAGNIVRYRNINSRSSRSDSNDFQVQTIEGHPAYIQTGKSVPVAGQDAYVTQGGVVVRDTVEYRDATSGFYVVPNLNGDYVTLSVSPNMSRVTPNQGGVFDVQNIETTVQGRLGEWISIGAIDQSSDRNNRSVLSSTRRRNQESRAVLIRVEELK